MEQKIRQLIKEAMLTKNKNMQITYKSILDGALKIAKADGNRAMTNADITKAIKNEIKQLNDLLAYVKDDEIRKTEIKDKLSYCEAVLPAQVSEEAIMEFLTTNKVEKNIGVCMKTLKSHFGESLDGKTAQQVVKKYIQ